MDEDFTGDVHRGVDALFLHQLLQPAGQLFAPRVAEVAGAFRVLGTVRILGYISIIRIFRDNPDLAPGVERDDTEPYAGTGEDQVAPELHPRLVGQEVDGQQYKYERGHPLDDVGEAHGEVVAVGVAVLVGLLHRTSYLQRHPDVLPKVGGKDKDNGNAHPYAPGWGKVDEAHGLQEQWGECDDCGVNKPVVAEGVVPLGKEIEFAHHKHLDGEEQQGESVGEKQRIGVANLHQVGQFEDLQQVYDAHSPLRREQLAEMLAIGLGFVVPLQKPTVQVGDDEGQVGRKEKQVGGRVGHRVWVFSFRNQSSINTRAFIMRPVR